MTKHDEATTKGKTGKMEGDNIDLSPPTEQITDDTLKEHAMSGSHTSSTSTRNDSDITEHRT